MYKKSTQAIKTCFRESIFAEIIYSTCWMSPWKGLFSQLLDRATDKLIWWVIVRQATTQLRQRYETLFGSHHRYTSISCHSFLQAAQSSPTDLK